MILDTEKILNDIHEKLAILNTKDRQFALKELEKFALLIFTFIEKMNKPSEDE